MEDIKQIKNVKSTPKRQTVINLFIILTILLLVLPFYNTISDIFTRIVINFDWYRPIKDYIVPAQVRMVAVILMPFGLKPSIMGEYLAIGREDPYLIEIAWNCIGWQSMLFFLISGWIVLQGNDYTTLSRIKTWIGGFVGTFLLNLLRISSIVLLAYFFGQDTASFFHDYGSTLVVIAWLIFFWWFSYKFFLEEKDFTLDNFFERK